MKPGVAAGPELLPQVGDHALTLAQALRVAQAHGLDRLDAQMLLLHALGKAAHDRAWLLAHDTDRLFAQTQLVFEALVLRRQQGEPMAYILGRKFFFGLELAVDARVLIPRPETEVLVHWALALSTLPAQPMPFREPQAALAATLPPLCVLDLGTGSGAVALALKHAQPRWHVHAVDASAEALAVAQGNAARLQLAVAFDVGHWFCALAPTQRFDVIVSNPPYIADQDPHLRALAHEPFMALCAGEDGLRDIRHIVTNAPSHLREGGWLLLEHGYDQAAAVRDLLRTENFQAIESRRDFNGIERCTGGRFFAQRCRI